MTVEPISAGSFRQQCRWSTELGEDGLQALPVTMRGCHQQDRALQLLLTSRLMFPALFLFPSGRGEAGAGSRERLPHGEGETNRLELLPAPHPHPALHL